MSDQNSLPDPNAAYNTLFELDSNIFFNKLASYGIQPANEKEAEELLQLGVKLQNIKQSETQQTNRFKQASDSLNSVLGQAGYDTGAHSESEVALNQFTEKLASDPAIYNAALSYKAAEAEAVAAEYGYGDQTETSEDE